MKLLGAYLLCVLGGNSQPSRSDVAVVLSSVGITADDTEVDALIGRLRGRDIDDLIVQGRSKLQISVVAISGVSVGGDEKIPTPKAISPVPVCVQRSLFVESEPFFFRPPIRMKRVDDDEWHSRMRVAFPKSFTNVKGNVVGNLEEDVGENCKDVAVSGNRTDADGGGVSDESADARLRWPPRCHDLAAMFASPDYPPILRDMPRDVAAVVISYVAHTLIVCVKDTSLVSHARGCAYDKRQASEAQTTCLLFGSVCCDFPIPKNARGTPLWIPLGHRVSRPMTFIDKETVCTPLQPPVLPNVAICLVSNDMAYPTPSSCFPTSLSSLSTTSLSSSSEPLPSAFPSLPTGQPLPNNADLDNRDGLERLPTHVWLHDCDQLVRFNLVSRRWESTESAASIENDSEWTRRSRRFGHVTLAETPPAPLPSQPHLTAAITASTSSYSMLTECKELLPLVAVGHGVNLTSTLSPDVRHNSMSSYEENDDDMCSGGCGGYGGACGCPRIPDDLPPSSWLAKIVSFASDSSLMKQNVRDLSVGASSIWVQMPLGYAIDVDVDRTSGDVRLRVILCSEMLAPHRYSIMSHGMDVRVESIDCDFRVVAARALPVVRSPPLFPISSSSPSSSSSSSSSSSPQTNSDSMRTSGYGGLLLMTHKRMYLVQLSINPSPEMSDEIKHTARTRSDGTILHSFSATPIWVATFPWTKSSSASSASTTMPATTVLTWLQRPGFLCAILDNGEMWSYTMYSELCIEFSRRHVDGKEWTCNGGCSPRSWTRLSQSLLKSHSMHGRLSAVIGPIVL